MLSSNQNKSGTRKLYIVRKGSSDENSIISLDISPITVNKSGGKTIRAMFKNIRIRLFLDVLIIVK